ncbi:MAG: glutathione peroxidase [Chitinispirillaceae bacterium]|nr:glutathione peroxidase [Chitinispirillaceae bacterium]
MKLLKIVIPVLLISVAVFIGSAADNKGKDALSDSDKEKISEEFYALEVRSPSGDTIRMSEFKGKTILIVNTATKCGLASHFEGLEKLHQTYKDSGLVVIGFPCNQFLNQEPVTNQNMVESCKINFGVTFTLTEKIAVNGKNTHPVFVFLKKSLPGKDIKWNFTKFLIENDGIPYKRYAPKTKPEEIEHDIRVLLRT